MYIRKRGTRKRVSGGSTEEVNQLTVTTVYMVVYAKHLSNYIFPVAYIACMISSIVVRSCNDMYIVVATCRRQTTQKHCMG